jgi:hypothetical protein
MVAIILLVVPCAVFVGLTGALRDMKKYLIMLNPGRLLLDIQPDNGPYKIQYHRWADTNDLGRTTLRTEGWSWVRESPSGGDHHGTQIQPDTGYMGVGDHEAKKGFGGNEAVSNLQIPKHGPSPEVRERRDGDSSETSFLGD